MDMLLIAQPNDPFNGAPREVRVTPLYRGLNSESAGLWDQYRLSIIELTPGARYTMGDHRSQLFQVVKGTGAYINDSAEGPRDIGDFGCSAPDRLVVENIAYDNIASVIVMRNWSPRPPQTLAIHTYDSVPRTWIEERQEVGDIPTGICSRSLWSELTYDAGSTHRIYEINNACLRMRANKNLAFWWVHTGEGTFSANGDMASLVPGSYGFMPRFLDHQIFGHGLIVSYIEIPPVFIGPRY